MVAKVIGDDMKQSLSNYLNVIQETCQTYLTNGQEINL